MPSTAQPSDTFNVLIVCTGNICRSPVGEQLFRARLDAMAETDRCVASWRDIVTFASAGTWAQETDRMPREAVDLSIKLGGDPSSHVPRLLVPEMTQSADLMLAMDRGHRSELARMRPSAQQTIFTLTEFARLLEQASQADRAASSVERSTPTNAFRSIVKMASGRKGLTYLADPSVDDVVDPYRRSQRTYDSSMDVISNSVSTILQTAVALLSKR